MVVLPLADPSINQNSPDLQTAFQQVAAGRAVMIGISGSAVHNGQVALTITGARLSNATPDSTNYLGYAAGSLHVFLADAPIGLTERTTVSVTVLARVLVQGVGPCTGFMRMEAQPPDERKVGCTISDVNQQAPLRAHSGDIWLAGGYYLKVSADWVKTGRFSRGAVYVANVEMAEWQDNDRENVLPHFFCLYTFGDGVSILVGFRTISAASRFAADPRASSHGDALCVRYSISQVKWKEVVKGADSGPLTFYFHPLSGLRFSPPKPPGGISGPSSPNFPGMSQAHLQEWSELFARFVSLSQDSSMGSNRSWSRPTRPSSPSSLSLRATAPDWDEEETVGCCWPT